MSKLFIILKETSTSTSVESVFSTEEEAINYCEHWFGNIGNSMWKSFDQYYHIEHLEFEPRVNYGL